jgi:HK97 family phage major capsid protein
MRLSESERMAKLSRINEIADRVEKGGVMSAETRQEFDKLETELRADQAERDANGEGHPQWSGPRNGDDGVGITTATRSETPTNRDAILQPEHRYSDWLKENHRSLYSEQTKENRIGSWPESWDKESSAKYWRGMCTGDWRNAEAEHRAAMAEGAVGTGGYLVPAPVASEYVDLLRDLLVVVAGNSHTVPWNGPGSTMVLPVAVTDVQVQNLTEGTDMYPPGSDITVNKYTLTARPYAAMESWSWELEEDSQLSIPDIVSRSFVQRMARAVQTDFFYGSGATNINGVSTTAGLVRQFEGGATPPILPAGSAGHAWTYVDTAITATRTAKHDTDMIITSPLCFSKYSQLQNSLFDALRPTRTVQQYIDGVGGSTGKGAFYQTTAIKDNITVGADTTDVSEMYFLDSDMIYWGMKHTMSVLPLRERLATQRSNGAIAFLRIDALLAHAEAAVRLQVKTS